MTSGGERPSVSAPQGCSQPTRRVNRGSGHTYFLDDAIADGVTTIIGQGVPKPALVGWAANETAGYAVDHWDELAELTPSKRLKQLQGARFETLKSATVRGTTVHKLAVAAGEGEIEVPDELVGHVDSYLQFIKDWQPDELLVEVPVFNRQRRYAGTLDMLARLADNQRWLLDWKTTASGIYPEAALQLAAYAHAEFYLGPDGRELPMPPIDAGGCVWLRADGYDLIPVDISNDTFRVFLYAQQVARFTSEPREAYVGEALRPPEEAAA